MALGEHELAVADLNEAIRLAPEGLSSYRLRAQAWRALHQDGHALADYHRILQKAADDAGALNGQAWIWATCPEDGLRSGTKAVASALRACRLTDGKDPYYLGTLAAAYAETGDFDTATGYQTRALGLFPKDAPGLDGHRQRLASYQARKPWRDAPAPTR
jgi:tetratricopeptide (TPR) repeat protein